MTVKANIMIRKSRSDKKDTTCKRCSKVCVNLNKLREHLKWKNLCRPQTDNQEAIQEPIQDFIQEPIQASVQVLAKVPINDTPFKDRRIE